MPLGWPEPQCPGEGSQADGTDSSRSLGAAIAFRHVGARHQRQMRSFAWALLCGIRASGSIIGVCFGVMPVVLTINGVAVPASMLVPDRGGAHCCGAPRKPAPSPRPGGGVHDVVLVVSHRTAWLVTRWHGAPWFDEAIKRDAVLDDRPVVAHPPTRVGAWPSRAGVAGGGRLSERSPVHRSVTTGDGMDAHHDEGYADAPHGRVEECMSRGAQAVPDSDPTRH